MTLRDWARPVVYWSLEGRDPEALRAFYAELFNWKIGDGPFMRVEAGIGGPEPGPAGHIAAGERGGFTLYVQVLDLEASLARVVELGGTVTMGRLDIPDGASVAGVTDPEGNPLVLVQQ
ncbi:MAG: uncharacterized protein QOF60_2262 [Actinomycetota bacterium]|nr:uncharacterized protein [Actinomycetota bacterium]